MGGSYPITVQFFGTGSGNHQFTFAGGSATAITIQPAAVNVVVNSTSKSYGAINPNFTGTLSGTYGADATNGNIAVIYSTTATQSSPVNGSTGYPITATGLTLSGSARGNYMLGTVTQGTLTINPAIVTGSVNSTSKTTTSQSDLHIIVHSCWNSSRGFRECHGELFDDGDAVFAGQRRHRLSHHSD